MEKVPQRMTINGLHFKSSLDVSSMVLMLRDKMPGVRWRIGDSEYEGFYVLGHTEQGLKIKISEDEKPGLYHLGVYSYSADNALGGRRRKELTKQLQRDVLGALTG